MRDSIQERWGWEGGRRLIEREPQRERGRKWFGKTAVTRNKTKLFWEKGRWGRGETDEGSRGGGRRRILPAAELSRDRSTLILIASGQRRVKVVCVHKTGRGRSKVFALFTTSGSLVSSAWSETGLNGAYYCISTPDPSTGSELMSYHSHRGEFNLRPSYPPAPIYSASFSSPALSREWWNIIVIFPHAPNPPFTQRGPWHCNLPSLPVLRYDEVALRYMSGLVGKSRGVF